MQKILSSTLISSLLLGGCSSIQKSWPEYGPIITESPRIPLDRGKPISENSGDPIEFARRAIGKKLPADGRAIGIIVHKGLNEVDGNYGSRFGAHYFSSPIIKVNNIVRGSQIKSFDSVKQCAEFTSKGLYLETVIADYDEAIDMRVEGFSPWYETNNNQFEGELGNRSTTDRFKPYSKVA